jgi:hypothetical protein
MRPVLRDFLGISNRILSPLETGNQCVYFASPMSQAIESKDERGLQQSWHRLIFFPDSWKIPGDTLCSPRFNTMEGILWAIVAADMVARPFVAD